MYSEMRRHSREISQVAKASALAVVIPAAKSWHIRVSGFASMQLGQRRLLGGNKPVEKTCNLAQPLPLLARLHMTLLPWGGQGVLLPDFTKEARHRHHCVDPPALATIALCRSWLLQDHAGEVRGNPFL